MSEQLPEPPNTSIPSRESLYRLQRARKESMDVALLRVGVYTVHSQSDHTYHVNIFEWSCTCPDWVKNEPEGGCKHMRRVDLDIHAGAVPRPDGRLPKPEPRIAIYGGGATQTSSKPSATGKHAISGPHREFDQYNQPTGARYFRCERCGREAMQRRDFRTGYCREE